MAINISSTYNKQNNNPIELAIIHVTGKPYIMHREPCTLSMYIIYNMNFKMDHKMHSAYN